MSHILTFGDNYYKLPFLLSAESDSSDSSEEYFRPKLKSYRSMPEPVSPRYRHKSVPSYITQVRLCQEVEGESLALVSYGIRDDGVGRVSECVKDVRGDGGGP